MPLVNIRLARRDVPTTAAQKAALIAGVTQLMQQVLDKRPESVTVIIDEVDLQNLFEAFSGIALECNRDEWMLRMRRMGSCPCKQPGRQNSKFIGPISLQPFGQVPCRAVCGVAVLANSMGYWQRTAPCIPSRQGTCAPPKIPQTGSRNWGQGGEPVTVIRQRSRGPTQA